MIEDKKVEKTPIDDKIGEFVLVTHTCSTGELAKLWPQVLKNKRIFGNKKEPSFEFETNKDTASLGALTRRSRDEIAINSKEALELIKNELFKNRDRKDYDFLAETEKDAELGDQLLHIKISRNHSIRIESLKLTSVDSEGRYCCNNTKKPIKELYDNDKRFYGFLELDMLFLDFREAVTKWIDY